MPDISRIIYGLLFGALVPKRKGITAMHIAHTLLARSSYRQRKESGFTLIELLVVILIIGILTAIAVPFFINQRKYAIDATVQSDIVNASRTVANWDIQNKGTIHKIPGPDSDLAKSIVMSSYNRITIRGNSADYCITGVNPSGAESLTGIVYSSSAGGLNQTSPCEEEFTPVIAPTDEGTLIVWPGETELPESNPSSGTDGGGNTDSPSTTPENSTNPDVPLQPAPEDEPADGKFVTCGDIDFVAKEDTFINCQHIVSNNKQDNFKLIVGSHSLTDIQWSVDVNAERMQGVVSSNLEVPKAFESDRLGEMKYRVYGKTNNGKNQPASAFVSNRKSHVLVLKLTKK